MTTFAFTLLFVTEVFGSFSVTFRADSMAHCLLLQKNAVRELQTQVYTLRPCDEEAKTP